ncbi:MAG TPA: alpha/beta hydrolase [Kofleriaceae bacterium]|jgi:pimeloyl-ACP methyl ester carboxylesterase
MTIRLATLSLLSIAACTAAPHPAPARPAAPTIAAASAPAPAPAAAPAPAPAATEALPFAVHVTGHGPAMILIPGLASSSDVWTTTVAHEQARFTCHVLQLPGFAGRPAIPAPMLSTVREALAGYIRDHHLDHPVIVGHSLGGFVALDLARSHPDLVGRLVIVDSVPFLPALQSPTATAESMRAVADHIRTGIMSATDAAYEQQERGVLATMITDPAQQEVALGWVMHSDRAAVTGALIEMMTTDLRPQLGAITAPTLVIETWTGWGAGREPIERGYAQQYASLRGVKLVVADTAKHFVMLDDPAFLFAQMDAFLR